MKKPKLNKFEKLVYKYLIFEQERLRFSNIETLYIRFMMNGFVNDCMTGFLDYHKVTSSFKFFEDNVIDILENVEKQSQRFGYPNMFDYLASLKDFRLCTDNTNRLVGLFVRASLEFALYTLFLKTVDELKHFEILNDVKSTM